jgi:hypothetical protein
LAYFAFHHSSFSKNTKINVAFPPQNYIAFVPFENINKYEVFEKSHKPRFTEFSLKNLEIRDLQNVV